MIVVRNDEAKAITMHAKSPDEYILAGSGPRYRVAIRIDLD